MAIVTPIWRGLRAVWGTLLNIWLSGAWTLLIVAGLSQMVWALLAAVGLSMPASYLVDGEGWGVFVLVIAILSGIAFWCSHHVALMPGTRESTKDRNPYLYKIVSEQAQLARLPVPKVIESENFTASAIGRSPRHAVLGVSPTLQCRLNRRELGAVITHEIAHVKNRDGLIMTATGMTVGFVLGFALLAGFYGWIGAIVLLPSVMSWLREFRADATVVHVPGNSEALASALNKLPGSSFFSFLISPYTHPPTKLRVWRIERLAKRNA